MLIQCGEFLFVFKINTIPKDSLVILHLKCFIIGAGWADICFVRSGFNYNRLKLLILILKDAKLL